jgi:hypothetical protein
MNSIKTSKAFQYLKSIALSNKIHRFFQGLYPSSIATLALFLSLFIFIKQAYWPSHLALIVGDSMSVNHTDGNTPAIYLPVSMQARGASSIAINRLILLIKTEDDRIISMRNCCTVSEEKYNKLSTLSNYTPIILEANTNLSKILGFSAANKNVSWTPMHGKDYEFWIVGWTTEGYKSGDNPDIKRRFKFKFTAEQVKGIEKAKKENEASRKQSNNIEKDVKEKPNSITNSWSYVASWSYMEQDKGEEGYLSKEKFQEYTK